MVASCLPAYYGTQAERMKAENGHRIPALRLLFSVPGP